MIVLVLDDVITSGSTLREAGRLLKEQGAAEVLGASLTHTEG
jgi:predicted amidophosphoribosyltransferase